jgi:hypothetical protein
MRPVYRPSRDSTARASQTTTVTLGPDMNVAQHDLLRLTAPDAGHLGGHIDMDSFDPDMNFETEGLLCVFPPLCCPSARSVLPY